MAIFNSYVKLPEGSWLIHCQCLMRIISVSISLAVLHSSICSCFGGLFHWSCKKVSCLSAYSGWPQMPSQHRDPNLPLAQSRPFKLSQFQSQNHTPYWCLVGNFREWSISSLSIIIPATPSNPSIPYVKRTSKTQHEENEIDTLRCHQTWHSPDHPHHMPDRWLVSR